MIHFTSEGSVLKLGLNLRRAMGGFVAYWMWYNFATHEASCYRFRLRLRHRPRMLWTFSQWSVIENHLLLNDFVLVNREWLADTNAAWRDQLRRDKASVQFGPHGQPS